MRKARQWPDFETPHALDLQIGQFLILQKKPDMQETKSLGPLHYKRPLIAMRQHPISFCNVHMSDFLQCIWTLA